MCAVEAGWRGCEGGAHLILLFLSPRASIRRCSSGVRGRIDTLSSRDALAPDAGTGAGMGEGAGAGTAAGGSTKGAGFDTLAPGLRGTSGAARLCAGGSTKGAGFDTLAPGAAAWSLPPCELAFGPHKLRGGVEREPKLEPLAMDRLFLPPANEPRLLGVCPPINRGLFASGCAWSAALMASSVGMAVSTRPPRACASTAANAFSAPRPSVALTLWCRSGRCSRWLGSSVLSSKEFPSSLSIASRPQPKGNQGHDRMRLPCPWCRRGAPQGASTAACPHRFCRGQRP